MPEPYHRPVLLQQCIDGLGIKQDGIYIDATFGGGGHSRPILDLLTTGHLYGFDQDPDARANAADLGKNFTFVAANFRYMRQYLRMHNVDKVDGVLADLGVSSHQIDAGHRGFSTRFDGALDMRMSQSGLSAREVINEYEPAKLQKVLGMYGEVKNARTLALEIAKHRPYETTTELKTIVAPLAPHKKQNQYLAQVFQAIRIEVNQEMEALHDFLDQAIALMVPGARLVIMSYHSLEDRMVKNVMRSGNAAGKLEKDFYGNILRPLNPVNRKPIVADEMERMDNPRARSAKLRIAERNSNG